VRLFLSYRRVDTAGRAGRLFDGLTQRLGSGSVFQDVASVSPGVDFEQALITSLAATDASIVVIGSEWASLEAPDGVRRLDRADDYVRQEVVAALASGRPVVPVLVGEAPMPEPDDVPAELRPLLKRQAFTLRDDAWNDDVDDLVRRLRSEVAPRRRRPRLAVLVAAGIAVVLVAGLAIALWPRDEDSGEDASTPPCDVIDDSAWSAIGLTAAPVGTYDLSDGSNRHVGYTVTALRAGQRQSSWRTLVDVDVSNQTTPVEATSDDDWYIDPGDFQHIVVDGVASGDPSCFSVLAGARSLPPGQKAMIRVGFDGPTDPRRSDLVLETGGTPIPLAAGRT
jgi:hypothetical protein